MGRSAIVLFYELRPFLLAKLLNRDFERRLLKAILEHQNEKGSVVALPGAPSTWGWVARGQLARRMGYTSCPKALSRKIRASFLWLEDAGYLKHQDVNEPGQRHGATRFLLAFFVFRIALSAGVAGQGVAPQGVSKAVPEVSRTAPAHAGGGGGGRYQDIPRALWNSPLVQTWAGL